MRKLPIVVDSREKVPLNFSAYPDVRVVRTKLWPGDYSVQSATKLIAIERKSVSDLIQTMRDGYAGFGGTAEAQIEGWYYRADIAPEKIMAFIDRIRHGWHIPVVLATSRRHATEVVVTACRADDAVKRAWRAFDKDLDAAPGAIESLRDAKGA